MAVSVCHCCRCDPINLCPHGVALDLGNECVECNEQFDRDIKAIRAAISKHEMSLYSLRYQLEHLTGVRR